MSRTARGGLVMATVALGAVMALVAAAYACTAMATLQLKKERVRAGAEVGAVGDGFRGPVLADEVTLRFDALDGKVLWEGLPDADGKVDFTFKIPKNAKPGWYTLVATQYDKTGRPVYGTPARTSIRVVASPSACLNRCR